ncbi:urease accessory protein UreE [Aestuariivirga litoralis]|uniref:Urease accessory protein UreE n=1 Tax=Aestuariivirga litoralis TaxID=2650924 RepID=A0A2W2C597_9HYPH|nr:urease accessory protein UreE [Aestuariivirga litoralis]PZF75333.1 urease accessory protein UreE [Aestuariivirga litoralis]
MWKATSSGKAATAGGHALRGRAVLDHGQRHLRRCRLDLADGQKLLVDLPETVALGSDDVLLLEDGGAIAIIAAEEPLLEVAGRDPVHLVELAWHIGNRHLPAEIAGGRIFILRDHVIKAMLEGLGARVSEVVRPFNPLRGAYSGHGAHAHGAQPGGGPSLDFRLDGVAGNGNG